MREKLPAVLDEVKVTDDGLALSPLGVTGSGTEFFIRSWGIFTRRL